MLNDQQGKTLSDQKKIKVRWKQYNENLYRRDERMTETFDQDYYEEEPVILENEVRAALKVLGGKKSLE